MWFMMTQFWDKQPTAAIMVIKFFVNLHAAIVGDDRLSPVLAGSNFTFCILNKIGRRGEGGVKTNAVST